MKLSQAVEGFFYDRDGESDDDLSPNTILLYRYCLTPLVQYLHDPELASITSDNLSRFMIYLKREYITRYGTRLLGYSRDNSWKAIRSFFNWANRELGISRIDQSLHRSVYAVEEIQPYSEEEMRKILDACDYTKMTKPGSRKPFRMHRPTATRDRAIVLLLLETGIRLGEFSRLKIEDIDLEAGEIHVHPFRTGKKSRARTISIEKGCKKALWHYKFTERVDGAAL